MDTWVLWFLLLPSIFQYPQPVGDGLDEATRLRMEARAKAQEEEKLRLEREVEQLALKQSVGTWRDLFYCALQPWQVWAVAGLVLLLLALWSIGRKRSLKKAQRKDGNGGAKEEGGRDEDAKREDGGNKEVNDVDGEAKHGDDGNTQQVDNVAARGEGNVRNAAGSRAANAANNSAAGNEVDKGDGEDNIAERVMELIEWPVQDLRKGCLWTSKLMNKFTVSFQHVLSNGFYPTLQQAIGVGSAFEGWSPREQDVVYQVLVPMTPPRGHSFHLELDTAGQSHVREFRIRVQQECTCSSEQQGEQMLCFLHHPEEELRANQEPSFLRTLCTGSYLDVEKTARWFCQLVRAAWPALAEAHSWHLMLLLSRRSCQFMVSNGTESYRIEMLFGVRLGNSDIFVSSQPRPGRTSSTSWPETYAVAEMKFFKYIASQAPPGSLHLKCLQFFTHLQLGLGFSTYTMKTVVMHLLSITPVSEWHRRHFVRRLLDISEYLHTSLQARLLRHFIVGNQRLPEVMHLPADVLLAESCNLFHDLVMDPVAHSRAMGQYTVLKRRLRKVIDNQW